MTPHSHNRASSGGSCRDTRARLSEALDRRLGRTDANDVRQHLLSCPTCRAEYDNLERLQRMTHGLRDEPVRDDFRDRLLARIEAGEGARPDALQHPASFANRFKLFASGAATAAALLISLWLVVDGLQEQKTNSNIAKLPPTPAIDAPIIGNPGNGLAGAVPYSAAQPVNQFDGFDPNGLGLRAVQKSHQLYNDLREDASRAVSQPPKRAMQKLAERSHDLIQSIRFLQCIDGTLIEMPAKMRSSFQLAENTARMIVERSRSDDVSRDAVNQIVTSLLREIPELDNRPPSITIRLQSSESFDLKRMFTGRTKTQNELHEILMFMRSIAPQGAFPSSRSGTFFTSPSIDIRIQRRR